MYKPLRVALWKTRRRVPGTLGASGNVVAGPAKSSVALDGIKPRHEGLAAAVEGALAAPRPDVALNALPVTGARPEAGRPAERDAGPSDAGGAPRRVVTAQRPSP